MNLFLFNVFSKLGVFSLRLPTDTQSISGSCCKINAKTNNCCRHANADKDMQNVHKAKVNKRQNVKRLKHDCKRLTEKKISHFDLAFRGEHLQPPSLCTWLTSVRSEVRACLMRDPMLAAQSLQLLRHANMHADVQSFSAAPAGGAGVPPEGGPPTEGSLRSRALGGFCFQVKTSLSKWSLKVWQTQILIRAKK